MYICRLPNGRHSFALHLRCYRRVVAKSLRDMTFCNTQTKRTTDTLLRKPDKLLLTLCCESPITINTSLLKPDGLPKLVKYRVAITQQCVGSLICVLFLLRAVGTTHFFISSSYRHLKLTIIYAQHLHTNPYTSRVCGKIP
jgi:hypothetical protein